MAKDRIYIEADDRPLYDRLEKEKLFKGRTKRELFLFAMSIGARNDVFPDLKSKVEFFHLKDLREEDEAIIKAIAMGKGGDSLDTLRNRDAVCEMAEKCATAGIKLLISEIDSMEFGSYEIQLEKELHDMYKGSKVDK